MIFKEYRIKDLFKDIDKGRRLKKSDRMSGEIPLVTAGETNMGISSYISNDVRIFPKNTITIDMFGYACYRDYEYAADDNIYVIHTEMLPLAAGLYVAAVIQKKTHHRNFSYSKQFRMADANALYISLPTTPSGTPDWEYMEGYIKEIEKKYTEKLDGFLKEEKLDDCRLTDEEEKVLLEDKEMGEFALSSIVEKVSLKCLKKDFDKSRDTSKMRTDEFSLPLATAATSGNGTVVYGRKEDFETAKMCIQILQNGDAGNVFIHPEEIGVLQDSYLVRPICENYSENQLLYISTAIQKKIKPLFSWHNKAGWNKIKDLCVVLPITLEGTPDYVFMDTYISAIKKKAISETVQYTNNRLKELEKITA